MNHRIRSLALAPLLAAALTIAHAHAAPTHWGASWIAAPEPAWSPDFVLPLGMPGQLENTTVRQFLRLAVGGERVRLVVDNRYGEQPLEVGRAAVSLDDERAPASAVTFLGSERVSVPPGAMAVSDPVDLRVAAAARLWVDLYLPQRTRLSGFHWDARDRTLLLPGDMVGRMAPQGAAVLSTRAFLSSVLVESAHRPQAVVALGDSITDGNGATPGADHRWPDFLAHRLSPRGVAVLNAGISGNRLLRPGMGEGGLARLGQDVLQQPGVRSVIVLLGTNDIGWPGGPFAPREAVPGLDELAAGFRQLVAQAHLHGVRVVGATVPPFEDALKGTPLEGHYSPAKDAARQALNAWIRDGGVFDAVVDFDRVLCDPSRPARLRPDFDSGDHLHPNDAGYRAMAQAVDMKTLLADAKPD